MRATHADAVPAQGAKVEAVGDPAGNIGLIDLPAGTGLQYLASTQPQKLPKGSD